MTTNTNTNTAKPRASYTLASKAANHPLTIASDAVSRMSHTNKRIATHLATRIVAIEHDVVNDSDITNLTNLANNADGCDKDAILALRNLAATIVGAHAYANKVLPLWVKTREDIDNAEFRRTSTAKTAKYEVVVTTIEGYTVHITCNSTASLDLRKIEKSYENKRDNAKKRAEKKRATEAKRAKRRAETEAKRATAKHERETRREARKLMREMLNNATSEQLAQIMDLMAA